MYNLLTNYIAFCLKLCFVSIIRLFICELATPWFDQLVAVIIYRFNIFNTYQPSPSIKTLFLRLYKYPSNVLETVPITTVLIWYFERSDIWDTKLRDWNLDVFDSKNNNVYQYREYCKPTLAVSLNVFYNVKYKKTGVIQQGLHFYHQLLEYINIIVFKYFYHFTNNYMVFIHRSVFYRVIHQQYDHQLTL